MTLGQLITALRKLNVKLAFQDGQVKLSGPAGFMSPALREAIEQHRASLAHLFAVPSEDATSETAKSDTYPLSSSQLQLWFEQQLHPELCHYNVPVAIQIEGSSSRWAVDQSVCVLIARHPALRARFPVDRDTPVMTFSRELSSHALPLVDIPPEAGDQVLLQVITSFNRRPFKLGDEPPIRVCLLRQGQETFLLICMHHIVADGWSMGILFRDFQESYERCCTGRLLPERKHSTAGLGDYSIWQTRAIAKHGVDQLIAVARGLLRALPDLSLPYDLTPPEQATYAGGVCSARLSTAKLSALSTVARRCGWTLFSIFSAAFMTVLHHESGQDRFAIGTDVAGREDPVWEDVVGDFVNQIVMVGDLADNPSLDQIIERASSAFSKMYPLRGIPFDRLVKATREDRPGNVPLFRAKIVMQPALGRLAQKSSAFKILDMHDGSCKFELLLNVWLDETVGLALEFSRDLFTPNTADRLMRHVLRILDMVSEGQLPLRLETINERLSESERIEAGTSRRAFSRTTLGTM